MSSTSPRIEEPSGGSSGASSRSETLTHNSHLLNAPDLQLDCLEDDDSDDDDEEAGSSPESTTTTMGQVQSATTREAYSSGEDGPSTANPLLSEHSSGLQRRRRHPFPSRSSGTIRPPKIPRLAQLHRMSRYPYLPHASLHNRARYQSELQRRFLTFANEDTNGANDTDPDALSVPMLNVRGLLESRGIDTRVGMLLSLIGACARGLRQEVIEQNSTTSKYPAVALEAEKCTICLVDFEADVEVRTLRCKHLFHTSCVDRWLKSSAQCPVCRVQVNMQRAPQEPPSGSG